MKIFRAPLLITFILFFSNNCVGQGYGKLIVGIYPNNSVIYLNDSVYHINSLALKLPSGNYTLKAWAPNHELVEININLETDSTIRINKTLPFSKDYIAYIHEINRYKYDKFKYKALPLIALGLDCGIAAIGIIRINSGLEKYKNLTLHEQNDYYGAIIQTNLDEHNELFNKYQKKYNQLYNTRTGLSIACIAVGGLTFKWLMHGIKKSKGLTKPTYSAPVLLSLQPMFNYSTKKSSIGQLQIHLTF